MFNRTYHVQRLGGGTLLAELLLRPAPNDPDFPFYRPANGPVPPAVPIRARSRRKCATDQLRLDFDPEDANDVFHHMPVVSAGSCDSSESFDSDELLAKLFS